MCCAQGGRHDRGLQRLHAGPQLQTDRARSQGRTLGPRGGGDLLGRVTHGAYRAVRAVDDGEDLLIEDAVGGLRETIDLSRGTREQLYVCLRLGLAAEHARRGADLPLVLDDVLVNFDPERADAMADILVAEAARRQILLLTCRPETVERIVARAPETRRVELPRWAGRPQPVSASVRAIDCETGLSSAEHAILSVLEHSSEPLGRSDVVDRAGLEGRAWDEAIRRLKALGLVVPEGAGRGATYRRAG